MRRHAHARGPRPDAPVRRPDGRRCASTSTSPSASSSRSSARTAPARRRCSISSPASTTADAGTVSLEGHDITGMPPDRLAALGVARTFQHGRVFAQPHRARQHAGRRARALQGGAAGVARPALPARADRRAGPRPRAARQGEGGGGADARGGAGNPGPLRRPPAAAQGQSGLQPLLRQSPPGRDRAARWRSARACCCSTSRPPA